MTLQLLRLRLVNAPECFEQPQRVARIDRALALLHEGLEELTRLGHEMHLAAGPEPQRPEWPRLVFHLVKAPRGYQCLCQQDFELLGGYAGGWHDTLDEAKHSAGMEKQFSRGGVFPKSGLPAVVAEAPERTRLDELRSRGLE